MNSDRLLAHYERIADAPDALPRLRRLILDLAVRGRLVEQDPNDEPASISVTGSKRYDLQQICPADVPGWLVAPVGLLLEFQYGKGKKASERLDEGPVPVFGSNGIVGYCETPLTEEPSIVVGRKGSAGALNLCDGPSWTTDVAYFVEAPDYLDLRYLLLGLQSLALESLGKGVKPGLSRSDVYEIPMSVPPLAEQRRIVAKVDELMALCDRLEAAREEREATRDRLAAASLALLDAPDPETFQDHARFALNALPALTARPDQIKQLRRTILNLAVRGKLVEQDPAEGTGQDLLCELKKARNTWETIGRVRPQKNRNEAIDDEKYLDLPTSWAWARLVDVGQTQTGATPSSANPELFGDFIPFVKPADLDGNEVNYGGPGLSEKGVDHSRLVPENAVLMVCIGATLGKVNKTTRAVCFNQQINSLTPFVEGITDFVALALKASGFQELAWSKAGTGTLPIISKGKWEVLSIPLPPLAEQHRIVAKVEELMTLCDRLEASLAIRDQTRHRLLDALQHEALAA